VVKASAVAARIARLSPHDCRCTCARLCHAAGGELEQIQFHTCPNPESPQYDLPLLPPRIAVERADPAVVRQVRAEEEAVEREQERVEARKSTGNSQVLRNGLRDSL
jgi:hypothetical protein